MTDNESLAEEQRILADWIRAQLLMDECVRRELVATINAKRRSREELEAVYGEGEVMNSQETFEKYEIHNFRAPYVEVKNRSTGELELLVFQHEPRFYWPGHLFLSIPKEWE